MAVDWSMAPPKRNIFADAVEGYEYGRQIKDRRETEAAYKRAAANPAEGEKALLERGDFRGAGYYAEKQAGEKTAQQQKAKQALSVLSSLRGVPQGQRLAALKQATPLLARAGFDAADLATATEEELSDQNLTMLAGEVEKKLQVVNRGDGGYDVVDMGTGNAVRSVKGDPKPFAMDPDKNYLVPDDGAAGGGASDTPISTARPKTDKAFEALIAQESGGRAGVVGPQTKYGRAEGMTQMLPETAEAMARKIGVPWNPALMRESTPQAAEYQRKLGQAYFQEGLQRYGGDLRKALMYYHGGPDERLWGPKTKAYADQVLARAGGSDQIAGGAGADDVGAAPKGYKYIQRGQPERWEDLPGGGQRNSRTGKTEGVPNPKPGKLTATALNQQNDHLTALQAASAINTRMSRVRGLLDSGRLDLGIAKNVFARGMNAVGMSNEESRNYASLRADLEKMRNDSLRLNKGVQTEGDAQRAWNELLTNLNDPKLVKQRLEEIEAYNRQAMAFHKDMVTQIREDSGMSAIDTTRFEAKPPDIRRTPPPKDKGVWSITPVGR